MDNDAKEAFNANYPEKGRFFASSNGVSGDDLVKSAVKSANRLRLRAGGYDNEHGTHHWQDQCYGRRRWVAGEMVPPECDEGRGSESVLAANRASGHDERAFRRNRFPN